MFESLVELDSEANARNYKHKGTSEDLPRESDATGRVVENLVTTASSASFSASDVADLSIIVVPHVAFETWWTHHVTKVLSPAFDADTLFYEVNVTSLTYSVDASASSEAATGLKNKWESGTRHLHCALDSSRVPGKKGACLGPRCDHNNLWSTSSAVLRVVETTSASDSARSTPQDLPLRLRLTLRSPFTCRAAGQSR